MNKVLIIGATSAIAEATAKRFAAKGDQLYLLARNEERLEDLSKDLRIRGALSVNFSVFDVNNFGLHMPTIDKAMKTLNGLDIVLIAHGTLADQKACEKDINLTLKELNTNAFSTISLLTYLANIFEQKKKGTLAVISSVAGDRGRQSNYIYGTSKGAINIFLQGLRNRLYKSGVHVLTIKPGFVDTPMTALFEKNVLWTSPEKIALGIEKAILKKKNVVYIPSWWRMIMLIIRLIPEEIFKRLSL